MTSSEENIFEEVFTEDEDLYGPTEEDKHNYWTGVGSITFFVQQNIDTGPYFVFEIEIEEYTGCAGGASETVGLDWLIHYELGLDSAKFKEGLTYTIHGLTAYFTRGDGWMTDDDVEYNFEIITYKIEWFKYLKQKVTNLWWQNIGWRIREWRKS